MRKVIIGREGDQITFTVFDDGTEVASLVVHNEDGIEDEKAIEFFSDIGAYSVEIEEWY